MCIVTATELKKNLSYYIELSMTEDVYIKKNKEIVSKLSNPKSGAFEEFLKLKGCLAAYDTGEDYDEMIGQEILRRNGIKKWGCLLVQMFS